MVNISNAWGWFFGIASIAIASFCTSSVKAQITSTFSRSQHSSSTHNKKISQTPVTEIEPKIVEAQKIVVDKNGDTFLVAESP